MRKISPEYETSREYKMLMILKHFRKGLKITCEEVANEIYYSTMYVYNMENTLRMIDETKLRRYANIVASRLALNTDAFYEALKKEAGNLVEIDHLAILNTIARLINTTSNYGAEIVVVQGSKNQRAVRILSCFRRILCINAKKIEKEIKTRINFKEMWKASTSSTSLGKYAEYIAERIGHNPKDFYLKLMQEADQTKELQDTYANAMRALGKILKE